MGKRKRTVAAESTVPSPPPTILSVDRPIHRRATSRKSTGEQPPPAPIDVNPATNPAIEDGQVALRASPDAEGSGDTFDVGKATGKRGKKAAPPIAPANKSNSKLTKSVSKPSPSQSSDIRASNTPKRNPKASETKKTVVKKETGLEAADPEADGEDDAADPEEWREALGRPPPVNSSYLPLPWKGRLGYACLNTYLRSANPSVFSSRTCRIASILEHRHPLKDPSQPEHATKNRPDKDQPADVARGQAYVEALGLANAKDIPKMLQWNDKFGIKFLRLSSEMFPFASHEIYGYRLAPFVSEALAEAGRVAAELGHRLTTHPGQFTQLGSPRKEVITASFRDLEYHCELLDLLKLPPQQNRDAVMILHMGGVFGDKAATIERFKQNYKTLSPGIKNRLVLENDDVCYSVHDLLPVCEELNIPLVLDYHHHNIIFDEIELREGTLDIMTLYDRIKATWTRKSITQKMHYSEPTPSAITKRQRRKHNPRVATLPPCAPDMDLMIEAKDKEQAVFELMRTFKLPGYDTFNDVIPHVRSDDNKPWKPPKAKKTTKRKSAATEVEDDDEGEEEEARPPPQISDEDLHMGGREGRVYWPPGMEHWLRPKKREVNATPRDPQKQVDIAEKAKKLRAEKAAWQQARELSAEGVQAGKGNEDEDERKIARPPISVTKSAPSRAAKKKPQPRKVARDVPTPSTSAADVDDDDDGLSSSSNGENSSDGDEMPDLTDRESEPELVKKKNISSSFASAAKLPAQAARGEGGRIKRRQSGRVASTKAHFSYAEGESSED